jgi:hypothetical protein
MLDIFSLQSIINSIFKENKNKNLFIICVKNNSNFWLFIEHGKNDTCKGDEVKRSMATLTHVN